MGVKGDRCRWTSGPALQQQVCASVLIDMHRTTPQAAYSTVTPNSCVPPTPYHTTPHRHSSSLATCHNNPLPTLLIYCTCLHLTPPPLPTHPTTPTPHPPRLRPRRTRCKNPPSCPAGPPLLLATACRPSPLIPCNCLHPLTPPPLGCPQAGHAAGLPLPAPLGRPGPGAAVWQQRGPPHPRTAGGT